LSDLNKTFTLSNLEREQVKDSESPMEARSYEMNELIIEDSAIRRGFTYDSESARNFDQTNIGKAKEGVKELLKDALNKAKRQAIDIWLPGRIQTRRRRRPRGIQAFPGNGGRVDFRFDRFSQKHV
jgi:hypothetical protein